MRTLVRSSFAAASSGVRGAAGAVPVDSNAPQQQFVLSNLDVTATLFVCDTGGNEAVAVYPRQAVTLETDSSFTIKSDTAGPTNYVLGKLIVRGLSLSRQIARPEGQGILSSAAGTVQTSGSTESSGTSSGGFGGRIRTQPN
jgi:hypothetical protein